jgi:hypothetical protein
MPALALAVAWSFLLLWGCSTEPQTFSPPVISPGRAGHAAITLLDGRILVIGGRIPAPDNPSGTAVTASAFILNPVSGRSWPVGPMTVKRCEFTATLLLDGRVLVAGGQSGDPSRDAMDHAEIFDPVTNHFDAVASPMLAPRYCHTATLLQDGRVLLAGGNNRYADGVNFLGETFDPVSAAFSPAGDMVDGRTSHAAVLLDTGLVLIAGGMGGWGDPIGEVELFDPDLGVFVEGSNPCPVPPLYILGARMPSGQALLLNMGRDGAALYDPASGNFESIPGLLHPRIGATMTFLEDTAEFVIIGGCSPEDPSQPVLDIEGYDPRTGAHRNLGLLRRGRAHHTATLLPDGRILLIGGVEPGGEMLGECEFVETRPTTRR